jgi:hypothetical protein
LFSCEEQPALPASHICFKIVPTALFAIKWRKPPAFWEKQIKQFGLALHLVLEKMSFFSKTIPRRVGTPGF